MPKFAANLTMLFTELPFLDRFDAACRAGFTGVEYLFPYDFQVDGLVCRLRRYGLRQVLHNLPAGDWARGERGIACIPGRKAEFRDGVEQAIRYATVLGCTQLNCLVGITPGSEEPEVVEATLIENLRHADARLAEEGICLLVEPVNTRDIPGFHLNRTAQARRLIEQGGLTNTFIQYDIYHMQIMEGDLARTIEANLDLIRHIQLADNPGRNEPGTGEINYDFLFRHLDRIGYGGWIGCEYKPLAKTCDGLTWRPPASVKPAPARAVA
jgi:hydroxypyruvate isomerase